MPFGIGSQELIIFLVIVLILFGPKNLPKLAKSMGRAVRDFKGGLGGVDRELEQEEEESSAPVETPVNIEDKRPRTPEELRQAAREEKKD